MVGGVVWKIVEGFFVKTIASFDDTLTRIPVISHLTQTRLGRVAFSVGTLLALTVVLIFAVFFSKLLSVIPYTRQIAAVLIFTLAVFIYFDIFLTQSGRRLEQKLSALDTSQNLLRIMRAGFIISFITLIDDAFVLVPLFLHDQANNAFSVLGVYLAAMVQILVVIYFGESLKKIRNKKELASVSLFVLSILVALGIV